MLLTPDALVIDETLLGLCVVELSTRSGNGYVSLSLCVLCVAPYQMVTEQKVRMVWASLSPWLREQLQHSHCFKPEHQHRFCRDLNKGKTPPLTRSPATES